MKLCLVLVNDKTLSLVGTPNWLWYNALCRQWSDCNILHGPTNLISATIYPYKGACWVAVGYFETLDTSLNWIIWREGILFQRGRQTHNKMKTCLIHSDTSWYSQLICPPKHCSQCQLPVNRLADKTPQTDQWDILTDLDKFYKPWNR